DALAINPEYVEAYINLGGAYSDLGMPADARNAYEEALRLRPGHRLRIILATMLPIVYENMNHLHAERQGFIDRIQGLIYQGVAVDLTHEMGPNPFYLAYQGMNDRDILLSLRRLYSAPVVPVRRPARGKKIKVGFISAFFKDHTIGRLMQGLI